MKTFLFLVALTMLVGAAGTASAQQHDHQRKDSMMTQMMHDTAMMRMMMDHMAADPQMRTMMMNKMMSHMKGDTAQMASMCCVMMSDPKMHGMMTKMACGSGDMSDATKKSTRKQVKKTAPAAPKAETDEHSGHH